MLVGAKYAVLLGGRSKFRGIQVAPSKNPWLPVGCWRWHENAGSENSNSLELDLLILASFVIFIGIWRRVTMEANYGTQLSLFKQLSQLDFLKNLVILLRRHTNM